MTIVLTLACAIGLVVAFLLLFEAARGHSWRRFAAARGWQHLARESGLGCFGRFRTCRTGDEHHTIRRLRGSHGIARVDVAELAHSEGDVHHLRRRRTRTQTACLVESPALRLPSFLVRPQQPLDELGRMLGGQDIDFEDGPAFSAAFVLQGEDIAAIRALFDVRVRDWFTLHEGRRYTFEGVGDALLVVAPRPLDTAGLSDLIETALELTQAIGG